MARIAARNASLYMEDNTGVCRAFSSYLNSITLSYSVEAPDITGFGENDRQRLPGGIKDWTLSFNAFFATGASEIDVWMNGILTNGASTGQTLFKFGPAGSSASSIMYSGCAVMTEYSSDFSVEGAATISGTLVARSGSLSRTSPSPWAQ